MTMMKIEISPEFDSGQCCGNLSDLIGASLSPRILRL
jgi:hypothetical protein